LTNIGSAPLSITSITITGADPADFAETNNCPSSLAGGANCTVSVTFAPLIVGSLTAALSITDNASGSPQTVSLSGTGVGVPTVSLSPISLTFGNQLVGTTSPAQNVTLSNTGTGTLTITSITSSGNFGETNTCGSSLAAGSSCTISVTFTPTATGTRTGTLSVTDNAAGSPQTVSLTGKGVQPAVKLSPTSLSFGNQLVGTTSPSKSVTMSNTGTTTLTINSISITGTNAVDFAETNTCGGSLAAGANCTISVTFTPQTAGSLSASVSVSDNAPGSPQTVSLTGTGTQPAVSLSPTSLTFSTQLVGTSSASKPVTLTNTGTATLTITSISVTGADPTDFSETNTCGSGLAAGASCTINVTFKPTVKGTRTASVSVADNAPGTPQTVSLTGTGTVVKLAPSSLNFGSVAVGHTSAAQTVTVTNTGTVSLSITNIGITGTNAGDFSETNTCGSSLGTGASCSVSVAFTPRATGSRIAQLSISDNGGGSPQTVSLSGTGT